MNRDALHPQKPQRRASLQTAAPLSLGAPHQRLSSALTASSGITRGSAIMTMGLSANACAWWTTPCKPYPPHTTAPTPWPQRPARQQLPWTTAPHPLTPCTGPPPCTHPRPSLLITATAGCSRAATSGHGRQLPRPLHATTCHPCLVPSHNGSSPMPPTLVL